MTKRLYLSPPHLGKWEEEFVKEAFESNWIAPLGPNVDAFENEMAETIGVAGCAALVSGTAAVHLALKYVGVKPGDYVLCSSLTFSGSCNPIIYEGGIPVFIDSDYETWCMSPEVLEYAIQDLNKKGIKPKAAIIVDLYGQSADYSRLLAICEKYGIAVIEDAAEAVGATFNGKCCGSLGLIGIFSFNGNKILTTSGGGMALSNDLNAIKKIKFWSTQSRDPARHYQHSELGYNYRMSNVLAGIGRGQLRVLKEHIKRRKEINQVYRKGFSDIPEIEFMPIAKYGEPNYWLTVITLNHKSKVNPEQIIEALEAENIESRPVWKPMHLQPFFEKYPFYSYKEMGQDTSKMGASSKPSVAEDLFNRGVCLPSGSNMSEADQQRVINVVRGVFGESSDK